MPEHNYQLQHIFQQHGYMEKH